MSNYCFIRCRDCDEETESINHGEEVLANLLKSRPQLIALLESPAKSDISVIMDPWSRAEGAPSFVYEHREHNLVVMDEYGAEYDEDGVRLDLKAKAEQEKGGTTA